MVKKSISVRDMGRSLGLGKTDSYWLVHKQFFETRMIAGKMRVMVESFEKWYANQLHYKKVNGEEPGLELLEKFLTVPAMTECLGTCSDTVYKLLHRPTFQSVRVECHEQRFLINKADFYEWLEAQTAYSLVVRKEDSDDRRELPKTE